MPSVNVTAVAFEPGRVLIDVRLRRRQLGYPHCDYTTAARHDTEPQPSSWRALDLGVWRVLLRARLRRLACPAHGVVVEAVPFVRHGARVTREVDDLVAWLPTKMDKTAITLLLRINGRTVGAIIERVVADELDPHRIDQASYRKQHHYLTGPPPDAVLNALRRENAELRGEGGGQSSAEAGTAVCAEPDDVTGANRRRRPL